MGKRARYSAPVRTEDFHSLESAHPYGLKPEGNRLLLDENHAPTSLPWNDAAWYHILSFADAPTLGKLVQVNKYFYVLGHQPEFWRDLTIRRMQGQTIEHLAEPTWKDSYIRMFHAASYNKPHSPMAVHGVYSDYLYRLHSCRSFCIPEAWLGNEADTLPKVPHSITAQQFFAEYEEPNQPLIIQGGAKSWPAFEKWRDPSYCMQQTKGRSFRATSGLAPLPVQFSLQAYYNYGKMPLLEEAPVYLFDRTALAPHSTLWNDFHPALCRTMKFWDPQQPQHDLLQYLGEGARPDHTWWIVGPRRSGSVFHIDPNATHAFNAAICGRKRWIFYPPGVTPPGVHPSADGDSVALPLSVGEWLLTFWDEHCQRKATAPPHERPLEGTAMPGDVLFVPHGWWHMVINMDDVNIAITHNYVAKSNLCNVLKFLSEKREQVSGCRDRPEAIKPETLYEDFVASLEKHHPEWLQEALNVPDWTCATWSRTPKDIPRLAPNATPVPSESIMAKAKAEENDSFSFSFCSEIIHEGRKYTIPATNCSNFGSYPNPFDLTDEDRAQFHPVIKFPSPPTFIDFSQPHPHSIELASEEQRRISAQANGSLETLPPEIQEKLKAYRGKYHVGRYDEDRVSMYASALFEDTSNQIESFAGQRTVHMGVDLDGPQGTPVYAFTDGTVHAVGKNEALGDYGNVIVVAHDLPTKIENTRRPCYALYGHLDDSVPRNFRKGDKVHKGQTLGFLGAIHENGGWFIPHVHFQLALSPPATHDLPGAVAPADRNRALVEFPDPRYVLGPLH